MTVIAEWNELALGCIARQGASPVEAARALQILHTATFDAWAAFDPVAVGVHSRLTAPEGSIGPDGEQAVEAAVNQAAYMACLALFPEEAAAIRAFMASQGRDPDATPDAAGSAGIGAQAAQAVLDYRATDLSNAGADFADTSTYAPVNAADPSSPAAPGGAAFDPNHWQPLRVPTGVARDAYGNPVVTEDPASYMDQWPLAPHFGQVKPFALRSGDEFRPPAPPQLGDFGTYVDGEGRVTTGDAAYRAQFGEVLAISGTLTQEQKAVAEYWADGPRGGMPAGHWNLFAQDVAARDDHTLAEDAQLFFLLNAALLDAGIASWEAKYHHDGIRPQSAIRDLWWNEEVTAWMGPNRGIDTVMGRDWLPYQRATFVTPAFPEFTSGHSGFSAAAAEILARFTGSDVFFDGISRGVHDLDRDGVPDLLGQHVVGELMFEDHVGPSVTLTWDSFTAAAEESGLSRLYGGVHIRDGDLFGQALGRDVAGAIWDRAQGYLGGEAPALLQGTAGTDLADLLIGSGAAEVWDAGAGDDVIRPGGGGDRLRTGTGADRVEGHWSDLAGLVVEDFGMGDCIVFLDDMGRGDLSVTATNLGATITAGGATVTLEGELARGGLLFCREDGVARLEAMAALPDLAEGARLGPAEITGTMAPAYLSGETAAAFTLTIEGQGEARFANALGVYLWDAGGAPGEVTLLTRDAGLGGSFRVEGMEQGERLGVFLVQDGARHLPGQTGDLGIVAAGDGSWRLARDGMALEGVTTFFSHAAAANADGMVHVTSGHAGPGQEALRLGFEDLMRPAGSDDDFQDVVLTVEADFLF